MREYDQQPLVSVYMATKNRAYLLKRAIESVLAQDYSNMEIVIVDDASTDETSVLLKRYSGNDERVFWLKNDISQGAAAARNKALEACRGKFVTGLDDDDYFLPSRISSLLNAYDERYAFVCSGVVWDFGHRKKKVDTKPLEFNLEQQLNYNHATTQVFVERKRFLEIGGYDTKLCARIDYDAWTRLILKYGKGRRISCPTYVLDRTEGIDRITNSDFNAIGNHQFIAKFKHLMSRKNLLNQEFWALYAKGERLHFRELVPQLLAGNSMMKLKHVVRNFFAP